MHLNDPKSDRTHLNPKLTQNQNSIKTQKNPKKAQKPKNQDFCSVYFGRNFVPNQTKIFFSNLPEKMVFNKNSNKSKIDQNLTF